MRLSTGLQSTSYFFIALVLPMAVFSQTVSIEGKAKVLEFNAPYSKIKIDMLDDKTEFIQEFVVNPTTLVTDRNGKPLAAEKIKSGSEVRITGKKNGHVRSIDEMKVTFSYVGDNLKLDGILENYISSKNYAVITGQRVKLQDGVLIRGISRMPKGPWNSFVDIDRGNRMEIEGSRKNDGFIYASKASVKENDYTSDDKNIDDVLGFEYSAKNIKSVAVPPELMYISSGYKSAPSGYASFGDANFKVDTSIYLQVYVNTVGNKLVPKYMREIPSDVPEKINFRFIVIDNPLFNAFSLPNGVIFINSGVLAQLDNEAQLAAILGHEISHVMYKDAKKRYEGQQKLKTAIELYYAGSELYKSVKTNQNNGNNKLPSEENLDMIVKIAYQGVMGDWEPAVQQAATIVPFINKIPPESKNAVKGLLNGLRGLACNDHDKDEENNADCVGLYYMQEAGYDPRESAKVWEKFMNFSITKTGMIKEAQSLARDWVLSSKMYSYKNPLEQIGDIILSQLINAASDNWFTSYPKASERYRNLNQLVTSYYSDDDFTKSVVGENEYSEAKERANQSLSVYLKK